MSNIYVVGVGMTVYAYQASNGASVWQETLNGFPSSAAIISVRTWPGEVTVGDAYQGHGGVSERIEVVIAAASRSIAAASDTLKRPQDSVAPVSTAMVRKNRPRGVRVRRRLR